MGSTNGCGFERSLPECASLAAILSPRSLTLWVGRAWLLGGQGWQHRAEATGLHSPLPTLDVATMNLQLKVLQAIHVVLLGDQWKLDG